LTGKTPEEVTLTNRRIKTKSHTRANLEMMMIGE